MFLAIAVDNLADAESLGTVEKEEEDEEGKEGEEIPMPLEEEEVEEEHSGEVETEDEQYSERYLIKLLISTEYTFYSRNL